MAGPTETSVDPKPRAAFSIVAPKLAVIRARRDFLAAARAKKAHATGFVLQARFRDDADPVIRIGYTCSKKVGNAVARNRAKRRLRAAVAEVMASAAMPGWDYVLIGRKDITASQPFDALCCDLKEAVAKIHTPRQ